ncbi:hypothetical protein FZ025_11950 [Xanthomonas hyacinthi]|uniref:Uncharacterized protein n=2 Tax=Xanthomonas hyacinthi TaxID=56455 RepID=A0A2S7EWP6_9XANT|nr:hypothetical protein Y886_20630 [Xanthomonas hyacinthi DSM 19077]PPU97564.1 hypothetical protein XhyaCFBP1156_11020 [Xanthomonas hyacinthi]QGY77311.1 hypothetical protein FZ025_11950 [Xanthomonas hyacinthi]
MAAFFFLYGNTVLAQESKLSDFNASELDQRLIDQQIAPIHSRAELQQYVQTLPSDSPLRRLTQGARTRFLDSLVFSSSGLASYSYEDIALELTAYEAYKLLMLFGQQATVRSIPGIKQPDEISKTVMSVTRMRSDRSAGYKSTWLPGDDSYPVDYPDHACQSRATCVESLGKICIGSNC